MMEIKPSILELSETTRRFSTDLHKQQEKEVKKTDKPKGTAKSKKASLTKESEMETSTGDFASLGSFLGKDNKEEIDYSSKEYQERFKGYSREQTEEEEEDTDSFTKQEEDSQEEGNEEKFSEETSEDIEDFEVIEEEELEAEETTERSENTEDYEEELEEAAVLEEEEETTEETEKLTETEIYGETEEVLEADELKDYRDTFKDTDCPSTVRDAIVIKKESYKSPNLMTIISEFDYSGMSIEAKVETGQEVEEETKKEVSEEKVQESEELIANEELDALLDKMIISAPSQENKDCLKEELKVFKSGILRQCFKKGVRYIVLGLGENLSHLDIVQKFYKSDDLTFLQQIRNGYLPARKLCVLGSEALAKKAENFRASVYLTAQAYDHSMGDDNFASLRSPVILNSYYACQKEQGGKHFIDGLSASGPVEYFACLVEAYLQVNKAFGEPAKRIQGEGVICTKEELYDWERGLYQYIEYLLSREEE